MSTRSPSTRDRQLSSLVAGYCAAGAFWGTFAASLPAIRADSGLATGDFGLLLFTLTGGAFPAMFVLSRHVHRWRRHAMPASLCLFGVGALALARSEAPAGLIASFVLVGAGSGALDISMNMRVSHLEDATGKALFNAVHAAFPPALLVASACAGTARDTGVDPDVLFVGLALGLFAAAIAERRCARFVADADDEVESVPPRRRLDRVLLLLGLAAALAAFAEMGAQSWSAIYLESILHASPTAAGVAFSMFTAGLGLGRLAAHALDAHVPVRTLVAVASGTGLLAFGLLGTRADLTGAMLCLFVGGLAVGPMEPSVFRTVSSGHAAAARGRALGLVTSVAYLGYLVSPPVLGALAEGVGWAASWWTVAVVFGAVAFVFRAGSMGGR